ncbi:16S rRNA (uracil(1498)-N(3))-methyltransferase [Roseateles koreensis]|uniref:Ribosomal RNA small subunit methyltransferase E n=1 Tax=Roseateles koreensis TaxID=2987526 RepID=A0ABT5KS10_9BURK|nr:16S rRNA (uracil(1498)-N(3))-methyltransferase [Roseateles koreensis]MDC8785728.1 16S rRNA (uracil(1498)-N(3))-methyltransferase [Roseateles koreensis]
MLPRLHVDIPLTASSDGPDSTLRELNLPAGAARHVQVLRLQPGAALTLFDGSGFEWQAEVLRMGRSEVTVHLHARQWVHRELPHAVTLCVVMPANDRMDGVIEKATELGAAAVQPLMSERSVLRLAGERADKKQAHWQGVAVAACEQSGRSVVPRIESVQTLAQWLHKLPPHDPQQQRRWLLSPTAAKPLRELAQTPAQAQATSTLVLSGPEGGLSPAEEQSARALGFEAVQLGPRILRADTAPLAVLGWLALQSV